MVHAIQGCRDRQAEGKRSLTQFTLFGLFSAGAFAASGIFFILLMYFERKEPAPLLDLSLFKVRLLTAGVLSHFFVSLSHTSTFFLLPFYLQGILRFTPTHVGLTIIFFSLVIVFFAPVGGWLADRLGSRMLCTVGSVLTTSSMFGFSRLGAESGQVAVMVPLMLLGLGWSLFQSPNLSGNVQRRGATLRRCGQRSLAYFGEHRQRDGRRRRQRAVFALAQLSWLDRRGGAAIYRMGSSAGNFH